MKMTKQDELNLQRFGCTVDLRQKLLYMRWADVSAESAAAATIVMRTIYTRTAAGPLLCLALEISPTIALARYCYFPFNLQNRAHLEYLSALAETGRLHFCLLAGSRTASRTYDVSRPESMRLKNLLTEAGQALQTFSNYSFPDAVTEFENTIRVAESFNRVLSDNDLIDMLKSTEGEAAKVSTEKRALAHNIVSGIANVLKEQPDINVSTSLSKLEHGGRTIFLSLFDFLREFGDDHDRLFSFIGDYLAVNMDEAVLKAGSDWPSKLRLIIDAFKPVSSLPEAEGKNVRSEINIEVGRALDHLGSGGKPSLSLMHKVIRPLNSIFKAQPGRPTKDYSREYELKSSGLSWSAVAAQHLRENAETRAEFGGRDFDSLDFEEKEKLTGRIRAGVTSFAERTGRQMPGIAEN